MFMLDYSTYLSLSLSISVYYVTLHCIKHSRVQISYHGILEYSKTVIMIIIIIALQIKTDSILLTQHLYLLTTLMSLIFII